MSLKKRVNISIDEQLLNSAKKIVNQEKSANFSLLIEEALELILPMGGEHRNQLMKTLIQSIISKGERFKGKVELNALIGEMIEDVDNDNTVTLSLSKDTAQIYHSLVNGETLSDRDFEPYFKKALKSCLDDKVMKKLDHE